MIEARPQVTDAPPPSSEVLIEEARRRQRRRRRATALALLIGILGTVVALGISGDGGGGPSPAARGAGNKSPQVRAPIQDRSFFQAGVTPPVVVESGLLAGQEGWVDNGLDLYLSTDDGTKWSTVTPRNLEGEDPVSRLDQVVSWGTREIVLSIADDPSNVCEGGSCRASYVDVSTDGGRSWIARMFPNCFGCGASLSMLSAKEIVAVSGHDGTATSAPAITTFLSANGGRSWRLVGSQRLAKSEAVGAAVGEETFSSPADGFVGITQQWLGNGTMAKTTDGGRHWALTPLPPPVGTNLKVFEIGAPFIEGKQILVTAGVAPPSAPGARRTKLALYSSSDGGARWSGHLFTYPPPAPGSGLDPRALSFVSLTNWLLSDGDVVAETTDAGRTWTTRAVTGSWTSGRVVVEGADFLSLEHGWADVMYDSCAKGTTLPKGECNALGLVRTDDGGRHWTLTVAGTGG